jgi:preprotein translocase subunit YajC
MNAIKQCFLALVLSFSAVNVFAADAASAAQPSMQESLLSMAPMLMGILLLFYFMIFRPQQKRQTEQRKLLDSLGAGDEIISAGGLVGRIVKISDDFIRVALADNVEITLQRGSIIKILPKGTMKSLV